MLRFFAGAAALVAALICTGTAYGQATLTPNPQDFGSVVEAQSSAQFVFTFTNNSSTQDIINSVVVSNPSEFQQPPPGLCSPNPVPAHATCSITLVFSPNATGLQSSTLTVDSTDAVDPVLTASLTGTGVAATTTATLTPASWTFPSAAVGAYSSPEQFVLTNTGNTTIGNISVGTSTNYSVTNLCTSTLAPQASCDINVVFHPTSGGTLNGTLTVSSTSSSGTLTSSLTGMGISPLSGLTLSPYPALSMGSYELNAGSSPAVAVILTNNDPTTITFSATVGAGGVAFPVTGDFAQTNNCRQTLAAGASCSANITFTPSATGTRIGSLTVRSSATNGTQTLTLSGNGTDYTASTATPSVTVVQGSTATYRITFTPISGYTNTITMGCSGLAAAGTSCAGNSTVFLGPAATANFSVTTTPKNLYGVIANGLVPNAGGGRTPWLITACSLLLLTFAGRKQHLIRAAGLLALLLIMLWPTGGCSGKQPTPDPDATQPGTYNFTFTAVDSAGDSKTLPLTLVVTAQ
ncbi:MAG TPA: choice-of-anchor D domain-containing protein [Acidobacteriaceae bacterium]|jgi:hypothetical protein|nr:choice-of-anchor D domain-containing protein [Acidobacteriaceae bacterium]